MTETQDLDTLAPAIANALALHGHDGWTIATDDMERPTAYRATLYHDSGRRIYMHVTKGRLSIGCRWLYVNGKHYCPSQYVTRDEWNAATTSITVSLTKDAHTIGREIARRLMPDYLRLWDVSVKRHEDETRTQNEALTLYKALAKTLNVEERDNAQERLRNGEATLYVNGCDFRVRSTGGVKFESYSITAERALQLAALVATWRTDEE